MNVTSSFTFHLPWEHKVNPIRYQFPATGKYTSVFYHKAVPYGTDMCERQGGSLHLSLAVEHKDIPIRYRSLREVNLNPGGMTLW